MSPKNTVFERLRHLQVSQGLTWAEVAKELQVSVSMLMMVKRGERNLSTKALYRLEEAERQASQRRSRAERVAEGLLAGEGTAAQLIEREARKLTKLDLKVHYSSARSANSLPGEITLRKPSEEGCAKLRSLFAQTMDTAVVLLACLPDSLRSERFVAQLAVDSRMRLTNGALSLVIPDWRTLVAGEVRAK